MWYNSNSFSRFKITGHCKLWKSAKVFALPLLPWGHQKLCKCRERAIPALHICLHMVRDGPFTGQPSWQSCNQTALTMRIHTAFTLNILVYFLPYSKQILMPVTHLSALAWVTVATVGRPPNTSSSITHGRYNASYVRHILTNTIKSVNYKSQ